MTSRPLLVFSLEGFATSAMGCYGSSWNETPMIDRLAANGCVWDRWISTADDALGPLTTLFDSHSDWIVDWKQREATHLITDNESLVRMNHGFDSVVQIQTDWPVGNDSEQKAAEEIEQTALATLVAQAIERDNQCEGQWSLMWIHSAALRRCWDAPRSLFPIDDIERDLVTAPNDDSSELLVEPPESLVEPIMNSVMVPNFRLTADELHSDVVTSWMRTYGCQVRLLDVLIDILTQSLVCEDFRVMVLGTSGMSLGQNGWFGHRAGPLRSHEIRLPMLISDAHAIRMPSLTSDQQLATILKGLGKEDLSWCGPDEWCQSAPLESIRTVSDRAIQTVTTPRWFCVRDLDQTDHLFLKPDDADDYNDVARLRPDVVRELIKS